MPNPVSGSSSIGQISSTSSTSADGTNAPRMFTGTYDEIDEENRFKGKAARKDAENFISNNLDNITYKTKWFSPNYIIYTPPEGSSMTYGDLRMNLGIPPRVLSEENNLRGITDKDVITGPVKITVDQIGWYERRMDNDEAMMVRGQRNYGDRYAGYSRDFNGSKEVSNMIEDKLRNK